MSEAADEQVRVVTVPPPLQWQLGIGDTGGAKVVVLHLRQGGWQAQLLLTGNDAVTLAQQLRAKGKDANSGITVQRTPLLGVDGSPIAVPSDADDDDDDDEAIA